MRVLKTATVQFKSIAVWSCALTALASSLLGDGGSVAFRKPAGPFVITLFTASLPLRVGASDLSVMTEDAGTRTPLLDAQVTLTLADAEGHLSTIPASRAAATNKLLYAATPVFPVAGTWTITVRVKQHGKSGEAAGTINVLPAPPAVWRYWPYFAIVPLFIALFALHQRLTRNRAALYARRHVTDKHF